MRNFYTGVYILSQMAAAVAAFSILYMICFFVVDLVTQGLFAASAFVQHGVVWHALAICFVWSLGYALEQGNLIRVLLLRDRLPARLQQRVIAGAAFFFSATAMGLVAICWTRVADAWAGDIAVSSASVVPVWMSDGALLVGALFFALAALAHGLRHMTGHPSPVPQKQFRLQTD